MKEDKRCAGKSVCRKFGESRARAAGLMEAEKGFRRVRGRRGMARLIAALERNDARIDGKLKEEEAA